MHTILAPSRTNTEPLVVQSLGDSPMRLRMLAFASGENPGREEQRPASTPKIILVPLALSSGSQAALAVARRLACEAKAKLVLLHVVQLNILGEERGIQRTRLLNELRHNAESQLRVLAEALGNEVAAEILVCEGRPAETIVETARRVQADAIVMSAHGSRGWLKWLHRNTALKVARQAPCRMWLVSPGRRDTNAHWMIVDFRRPRVSQSPVTAVASGGPRYDGWHSAPAGLPEAGSGLIGFDSL